MQETKWRGSQARNIPDGLKLMYHGVDEKRNGVEVIMKEEYANTILEVKTSDWLMWVKLELRSKILNLISAYGPPDMMDAQWKRRSIFETIYLT